MSLGPFASHPRDSIASHTAHTATADSLTAHFEEIVSRDESMPHRYGELQVLASQAIARVRLLERQIGRDERRVVSEVRPRTGNVVPLGSKRAPEPVRGRPGA